LINVGNKVSEFPGDKSDVKEAILPNEILTVLLSMKVQLVFITFK
jgi:hypothetical protein